MAEFTGERLVPGQVDIDLYHEHLARYEFCSQLPLGSLVLDAGCGMGYGTALLGSSTCGAVGVDYDAPSILAARRDYSTSATRFLNADVCALPFPNHTFTSSVSFEVIEHLDHPERLVRQLSRVTKPDGLVIISTPNKQIYDVLRGDAGPNPYHVHEFNLSEFLEILCRHFAHVRMFGQDHTPAIAIRQTEPTPERSAIAALPRNAVLLDQSQFFISVCSQVPIPDTKDFVSAAISGNVLFERERHIRLLTDEVATKDQWLEQSQKDHQALLLAHKKLELELEEKTLWAQANAHALETKSADLASVVSQLHQTENMLEERTQWATAVSADLKAKCEELSNAVAQLHHTEQELTERTSWAMTTIEDLQTANGNLASQLSAKCDELKLAVDQLHHVEGQLNTERSELQMTIDALRNEVTKSAQLEAELARVTFERSALANSRIVKLAQWAGLLRASRYPKAQE